MKPTCEGRWGQRYAAVVAGATLLATALLLSGCAKEPRVPAELVGTWVAEGSARYAGSSFEVGETGITFRRGAKHEDRNVIVAVTVRPEAGRTSYEICYRNYAGGEVTLSLFLHPAIDGDLIRFKYQPEVVWRRRDAAGGR